MRAREKGMTSGIFGDDLPKLFPLVNKSGSDSAALDNAVELLYPERAFAGPYHDDADSRSVGPQYAQMDADKRAFYEYHACMMEPWDGPAAVAFTDGIQIGAVLDSNGLRPARYLITDDDLVIAASETGVVDIAPERVVQKGRLQPGKIFLIDTAQGRIIQRRRDQASGLRSQTLRAVACRKPRYPRRNRNAADSRNGNLRRYPFRRRRRAGRRRNGPAHARFAGDC